MSENDNPEVETVLSETPIIGEKQPTAPVEPKVEPVFEPIPPTPHWMEELQK